MEKDFLNEVFDYIVNLRRWFHQHPELSCEEVETSKKIQDELTLLGIPFIVTTPSLGVIGTITGDIPSKKCLGIRADFDALPIVEDTGLEFCSKTCGKMHACGHDAHAAMLLGVAKILMANKSKIAGTIKLVFQTEEEIGKGHKEVIEHLDKDGGLDHIIGLHIWSNVPSGEILLLPESIFAGLGEIKYTISGAGGHGARPDLVRDPIKATCDLVMHLSAIPSNFHNVLDNVAVTTCMIEAGNRINIFPTNAKIGGTYRYFKPDSNDKLRATIERVVKGIEDIHNVTITSTTSPEHDLPPIYNTREYIDVARSLVSDIEGLELSSQVDPISASDNFGFMVKQYTGFYGILGGGKHNTTVYPHHHPKFDIDEDALLYGSEFMARYALNYCKD